MLFLFWWILWQVLTLTVNWFLTPPCCQGVAWNKYKVYNTETGRHRQPSGPRCLPCVLAVIIVYDGQTWEEVKVIVHSSPEANGRFMKVRLLLKDRSAETLKQFIEQEVESATAYGVRLECPCDFITLTAFKDKFGCDAQDVVPSSILHLKDELGQEISGVAVDDPATEKRRLIRYADTFFVLKAGQPQHRMDRSDRDRSTSEPGP